VEDIVTGEAVVLDLPYARFPTRMLAHLIDMLVQLVMFLIVGTVAAAGAATHTLDAAAEAAVSITGLVAVIVGYPAVFETLSRGRTLGKLALGLRVVADDGGPERFRQALVRALAGSVECWALIGIPALVTSVLSARGKRLGDIFAGTFVVRERTPRPPAAAPSVGVNGMPSGLREWAATLDLSGLPEPVAAAAASYLSRYGQFNPAERDRLGWQLAADIAARVTPAPPSGLSAADYLHTVLTERRHREFARLQAGRMPAPVASTPVAAAPPPPTAGTFAPPPPGSTFAPPPPGGEFAPPPPGGEFTPPL
jgi:uncharacterized RDD family membrane protein YckC